MGHSRPTSLRPISRAPANIASRPQPATPYREWTSQRWRAGSGWRALVAQRELRDVPGRDPVQRPRNGDDEDARNREQPRSPENVPASGGKNELPVAAFEMSAHPPHPCPGDPSPTDDGDEGDRGEHVPGKQQHIAAGERERAALAFPHGVLHHPFYDDQQ